MFPPEVEEKIGYYVYRLVDPRDRKTFYIGKGKGNRVFSHVAEALAGERDTPKLSRIRDITAAGHTVEHIVHRHGLTEREALLLEAALIDAYQDFTDEDLHNAVDGHHSATLGVMGAVDVLALYTAPAAAVTDPVILVNLNQQWYPAMPAADLYEYTRRSWACQPGRHKGCRYALAVKNGIIRQVYAIGSWALDPRYPNGKRWMFDGVVAADKAHYVGQSVRHLLKGAQNPIKWVNC